MAAINGTASWGIIPLGYNSSNLATMSFPFRTSLRSANDPLRYQAQIFDGSSLTELTAPSVAGDVVNAIFKVDVSVDGVNYERLAQVKKSRDVTNYRYDTGAVARGHRFTVDIAHLISNKLSYSLCPINKGTWQGNYYGGMNGGLVNQDNIIGWASASGNAISDYNVNDNGSYLRVKVKVDFEILDSNGTLELATSGNLSHAPEIYTLNIVSQFEKDDTFYFFNSIAENDTYKYKFLTRCPNYLSPSFSFESNTIAAINPDFHKPVRLDEEAEWLQFFIDNGETKDNNTAANNDEVAAMGIEIKTYIGDSVENTFYLTDFLANAVEGTNAADFKIVAQEQKMNFIQNVSPFFINNTAALKKAQDPVNRATGTNGLSITDNWTAYTGNKITASTTRYTASLVKVGLFAPYVHRVVTGVHNFEIDRETANIPYGFVRFHWLNSMGGVDSYTAKRDVTEGLTINREVIERKSADRTWYQADSYAVNSSETSLANSDYISDTMRGGNLYKGGREVIGVNADKNQSVYTEPLQKSVAKWLEEMLLSPNVWIEMDTDATKKGNTANPYLRPSTKEYIPVIITNSEFDTVNQAEGLVKLNVEYTLSHKVQTQRN